MHNYWQASVKAEERGVAVEEWTLIIVESGKTLLLQRCALALVCVLCGLYSAQGILFKLRGILNGVRGKAQASWQEGLFLANCLFWSTI